MGCDYYYTGIGLCGDGFIRFSEMDDSYRCLCTFPHNDGEVLTKDRLRSLALLGAAVVLRHQVDIDAPMYLPEAIPDWIKKGIDEIIGYEEREE